MCGIWLKILKHISGGPNCDSEILEPGEELEKRGPDCVQKVTLEDLELVGCVLHLRGPQITSQPIGSARRWLLWNGEAYGNNVFGSLDFDMLSNDTSQIFSYLASANPMQVLSQIEGCFAFVYVDDKEIWFGRDFLGRRSLVISRTKSVYSVCSLGSGTQVPTGGLFRIDLENNTCNFIPWPHEGLIIPSCLRFRNFGLAYENFEKTLEASVQKRTIGTGDLGILFSGGLDCTVIAALALRNTILPLKIYLVNVAFAFDAPDRLTAIASFEELRMLEQGNRFELVLVDVGDEEIETHRSRIVGLMGNNNSRMDFSIATALYFASRGEGRRYEDKSFVRFDGKILLSGMGADEIFGGYSRYRSNFKQYGNDGIVREMSLDLDRLWHRNLGRDDRVTACHSRELRFPYLDTHLWQSLSNLHLDQVTDMRVPGKEKFLLRNFCRKLGLNQPSDFKKRAIQFGTRISKLCNMKDFGSNRKAKGWQSIDKSASATFEDELEFCCKNLEEKILEVSEEEKAKLMLTLNKLKNPSVKTKDKRHLMRVYLGDYTSHMTEDIDD